jgi:hypothetical protein
MSDDKPPHTADELRAKAAVYADQSRFVYDPTTAELLNTGADAMERVAALEEALRFYANPWKYKQSNVETVPDFYDEMDFGETARAALGEKP